MGLEEKDDCKANKSESREYKGAWWNDSVQQAADEKKKAYLRVLDVSNQDIRKNLYDEYKERKKNAKGIVKASKEWFRIREGEKMQKDFESNRKLFWKWVRNVRQSGDKRLSAVLKCRMAWEEEQVRKCWKNYFDGLYGRETDWLREVAEGACKVTYKSCVM